MSKVYNKIVQSNTEPSKNDIWLKDGQMKTFGKEGWESIGGGSSLDANTPIKESVDGTELVPIFDGENKAVSINELVKGDKEVYVCTIDSDNHTNYSKLLNAIERGYQILIKFGGITSPYACFQTYDETHGYNIICYPFSIIVGQNSDVGVSGRMITIDSGGFCGYDGVEVIIKKSGDGTKFLSDDGTYRIIASNAPYIFNYTGQTTVTQDEYNELKNAIENHQRIIINMAGELYYTPVGYNFVDNTIALTSSSAEVSWVFQITNDLVISSHRFFYVDELTINQLTSKITALEERIAALEGTA
jgi:hypothetical protein